MARVAMIVWNEFRNDARVLKEAETLQAAGHRVTVFALHTPGVTREKEELASSVKVVRVVRSPLWRLRKHKLESGKGDVGTAKEASGPIRTISPRRRVLRIVARLWTHCGLAVQMLKLRPQVVHSHDVNTLPTAWLVATLSRAKLVYDAHEISTSREGYASFRRLVGGVEKKLMPRANGTITTTEMRARFFARAYGVPRPLVLQNRPRFNPPVVTNRIRRELGLVKSWPIVLYQGGLQQGRGLERLIEVAAQVRDAYFVFIGGGRLTGTLQNLVEKLEVSGRVFFIPTVPLDQLLSYTASADVGVQPLENTCLNHFTTDSNKLFEYVAAGLPVVASNFPEIRKVVRQYDLGLLVEPGNTEQLSNAIKELVDDEQRRCTFKENARRAAPELTWEAQEDGLVKLYEGLFCELGAKEMGKA